MAEQYRTLDVAGLTDVGIKRKKNEDFYDFTVPPPDSPQFKTYGAMFVVADGMGGMGGGDAASQVATKTLLQRYYAPATQGISPLSALKEALEAANVAVREEAKRLSRLRIGSTGAGLVLLPDGEALVWNVGDSRVYRVRQSYIELLTHDQSVVQAQIDGGLITEEEAREARNVNVTAFLGQPTPIQPVLRRMQTQLDDVFLMCSDGLWDLVEAHELLTIVQNNPAEAAAKKLIKMARDRGGPDNITVIIVRLGNPPRGGAVSGPRMWYMLGLLALVAVVIAGIVLLQGGGDDGNDGETAAVGSPTMTNAPTEAAVAAAGDATPTARKTEAATNTATNESTAAPQSTDEPTAASGVILITNTPTNTPEPTATNTPDVGATVQKRLTQTAESWTDTPTPLPTDTAIPTATRTATPLPTDTDTPTPEPSRTSSPTRTPLPTNTDTPTATDTLTPRPSATPTASQTPHPTTTINPTVITWTPTLPPTATPTTSPVEQLVIQATADGVHLNAGTTLYSMYTLTNGDIREIGTRILDAGTTIRLINRNELDHPNNPDLVMWEVRVVDGINRGAEGWIDKDVFEDVAPLIPFVRAKDVDVNMRFGDGTVFRIVSTLTPGEIATVLGVSRRDPSWLKVERINGQQGWVWRNTVDVFGDLSEVERLTPPPRPTAIPTDEPTIIGVTASPGAGSGDTQPSNPPANNPPPPAPTDEPPTAEPENTPEGGYGGIS